MGPRIKRSIFHSTSIKLIMRKYIRLLLFITAFLSCCLMLIYHQKYSKLNVILQVMNAFGVRNTTSSNCAKKLQELTSKVRADWSTIESTVGIAAWTEVFPNVHMYSSFWFGNESNTLTFVNGLPDIASMECQFSYDNGTISKYVPASSQLFRKKKGYLFFLVKCPLPYNFSVPHSVSFRLNKLPSVTSMPLLQKQSSLGMFSMCVEPLPFAFNDIYRIIEFLVYHHHLGINHFLIYDKGMSSNVKKLLLQIAPKSNIYVTLLPWNIPFSYQSASEHDNEYFVDCVHRVMNRNYSSFLIHGTIDRFIVLKGVKNLTVLLTEDKSVSDPPRFYEHLFCLEYPDDLVAHHLRIPFVSLLKEKSHPSEAVSSLIYSVPKLREQRETSFFKVLLLKGFPQKSAILPKHIGLVHSYRKCNDTVGASEKNLSSDKFMWKYKNLFFKSKLYTLAKQQNMVAEI